MVTTRVLYSCFTCGVRRRQVDVPARENEDVRDWLDATVRQLAHEHQLQFPLCRAGKFDEVFIPTSNTDRIGGPVLQ